MRTAAIQKPLAQSPLVCPGGRSITLLERPLVMGVLNLTPDSFSDGGLWLGVDRATARAEEMVAEGAELLDLGAESTRPGGGAYGDGAEPVSVDEELQRLLPVLESIRDKVTVPLSVDTRKGAVARAALEAGADLINDITALDDRELARAVAEADCPVVLMHSRGSLASMQRDIHFDDLLGEVTGELAERVSFAESVGIRRRQILIDPGIGFGKRSAHNLELLRRLDELKVLGLPVVVGASRKSFIGDLTGTPADRRLPGSLAAAAWAARLGAAVVRVHDVAATVQFLEVWRAIDSASGGAT